MLYQLGIILIIVVIALIISMKIKNNSNDMVYEDEMDEKELKEIDDEIK
jgi:hypothetical protein|tara:strand:+ start:251 stop:397 length:147 start_codon:yes stop_codon:yes gene_type:complete